MAKNHYRLQSNLETLLAWEWMMEKRVELQSTHGAPLPRSRPRCAAPARAPAAVARARLRFMFQTFRPNICSKRLLDWHFMTTSGTAAACGAAARPRAMCPLARRAPSVASPQRFSSSLSFSLALSLALFLFASWSSQVRLHRRRALRPRRRVRRGGVIWAAAQWCVVCGVGVWCVVCDRT